MFQVKPTQISLDTLIELDTAQKVQAKPKKPKVVKKTIESTIIQIVPEQKEVVQQTTVQKPVLVIEAKKKTILPEELDVEVLTFPGDDIAWWK